MSSVPRQASWAFRGPETHGDRACGHYIHVACLCDSIKCVSLMKEGMKNRHENAEGENERGSQI